MRMTVAALSLLLAFRAPVAAQQDAGRAGRPSWSRTGRSKRPSPPRKADEARTLAEQVEICEVEAPPFKEAKRAELYARKFRELGLQNVRIDKVGNVLGERPGSARRGRISCSPRTSTRCSRKAPT